MKIYERELPQKQYRLSPSCSIAIPRGCKPKQGDQYIGYWETYQIDRVSYNKGDLILYCTKARNHTMSKAQQYICRRVEHG